MDWIEKYEKEHRARLDTAQEEKRRHEEKVAHFAAARKSLRPSIIELISEVERRTGVTLGFEEAPLSMTVYLVRDESGYGFTRKGNHRFQISSRGADPSTIHVKAIEDNRYYRPGECPDDMSPADWEGVEKIVVDCDTDLKVLCNGDLNLLMEWLVQLKMQGKTAQIPRIAGVQRQERKIEQERKDLWRAKRDVYVALACGIFGLGLSFLGPVALVLGIRGSRGLKRHYGVSHDVENCAAWAIGLGGFGSFVFALTVFLFLKRLT
jgi:hypothetical protein